ncbi:hypothetical protein BH24CHL9_BH24CHL9_06570 [soil metagenome]
MRAIRLAIALAIVMLASVVVAPTVGAYNEAVNTGTNGEYANSIQDESASPGVTCRYVDKTKDINDRLAKVRVRGFFAHGPFAKDSLVGYRFIVKRQAPPYTGAFKTVYRSPIIKKKANTVDAAGFPTRTWTAPDKTKSRYRVQIFMFWYAKGSTTKVVGRARGLLEAYKHVLPQEPPYVLVDQGDAAWCRPDYHGLLTT